MGALGRCSAQLRHLQQLHLTTCDSLTDADMQHFSSLTGLQLLDLTAQITSNLMAAVPGHNAQALWPGTAAIKLRHLNL
jgi:hypothetical protein